MTTSIKTTSADENMVEISENVFTSTTLKEVVEKVPSRNAVLDIRCINCGKPINDLSTVINSTCTECHAKNSGVAMVNVNEILHDTMYIDPLEKMYVTVGKKAMQDAQRRRLKNKMAKKSRRKNRR